jgi:hypothetical protein
MPEFVTLGEGSPFKKSRVELRVTDFNSIEGQGQGYPLKWPYGAVAISAQPRSEARALTDVAAPEDWEMRLSSARSLCEQRAAKSLVLAERSLCLPPFRSRSPLDSNANFNAS